MGINAWGWKKMAQATISPVTIAWNKGGLIGKTALVGGTGLLAASAANGIVKRQAKEDENMIRNSGVNEAAAFNAAALQENQQLEAQVNQLETMAAQAVKQVPAPTHPTHYGAERPGFNAALPASVSSIEHMGSVQHAASQQIGG